MVTLTPGTDCAIRIGGELDDDGTTAGPRLPSGQPATAPESAPHAPVPRAPTEAPAAVASQPAAPPQAPRAERQVRACQVAAQTIVMGMFDHLRREAGRRDNLLTIDDIAGMREEFRARAQALEATLRHGFEQYFRERAREQRKESREYPFDRIIVHQFAHLFVRRGDGLEPGLLSRRVLPGFFIALDKMLGETALEEFQDASRRIVARYAEQLDADGNWGTLYADPLTRSLVLDALIAMAAHFEEFEKRCDWLRGIVNGHLAPGERVLNEGGTAAAWELSQADCLTMVQALFRPLEGALADPACRKELIQRHGQPAIRAAGAVTTHLDPVTLADKPERKRKKASRPS